MAIIQISKIQQRSGNLVDLPELSEAEMGWATDDRRLFIGRSAPYSPENVEVLTSYSNISFSQIDGSGGGNVFITGATNGQILSFDGTNWVNKGGAVDKLIDLGDASNVKITGGAIGYVLETDGTGNLSWSSKGTLQVDIIAMDNSTPVVMTVDANTPYTNDALVTISGVDATLASIVNGQSFYVKVATNFPTTGNVELYANADFTGPLNGTGFGYVANGVATSLLAGAGGGSGAGGANSTIQFNSYGLLSGDAGLTFNNTGTKLLSVNGNISTGNITASGNVTGTNIIGTHYGAATGLTAIPGANVSGAVSYATTANAVAGANVSGTVANATYAVTAGTVTTHAQPNITSVGALAALTVSGVSTLGPIGNVKITGGSNTQILQTDGTGNLSWTDNSGGYYLHTQSSALTTWTVVHNLGKQFVNVEVVDITGNSYVGRYDYPAINFANANALTITFSAALNGYAVVVGGGVNYSNSGGNSTAAGFDTQVQFNDGGNFGANSAFTFATSTGTLSSTLFTGTVTTNAQPNITSVGTLTGLVVSGNITPSANITYNLGNNTNRFNDLYLANSTIYLGPQTISANSTTVIASNLTVTNSLTAANFVGSGAGTPTVSSVTNLDLSAPVAVRVVGGGTLRLPNLTSAAIAGLTPANGDTVYNTTTDSFQVYEAGVWVSGGGAGVSGFSGYSGLNGASSASGFSGYSGIDGTAGTSGYSGVNGGTGTSGYSGIAGPSTVIHSAADSSTTTLYPVMVGATGSDQTPKSATSMAFNALTGTFTAGNLVSSGTVTAGGAQVIATSGGVQVGPIVRNTSTGVLGTITIPDTCQFYMFDAVGVTSCTLLMPANPVNGQVVEICVWYSMSGLVHQASPGQNLSTALSSAPVSGTGGKWVFMSATGAWFRTDLSGTTVGNGDNSVRLATTAYVQNMETYSQLGRGQGWINLTSTRQTGVYYTNSTGKPIQVVIYVNPWPTDIIFYVDYAIITQIPAAINTSFIMSYIIPPGSIYQLYNNYGTTYPVWAELRDLSLPV